MKIIISKDESIEFDGAEYFADDSADALRFEVLAIACSVCSGEQWQATRHTMRQTLRNAGASLPKTTVQRVVKMFNTRCTILNAWQANTDGVYTDNAKELHGLVSIGALRRYTRSELLDLRDSLSEPVVDCTEVLDLTGNNVAVGTRRVHVEWTDGDETGDSHHETIADALNALNALAVGHSAIQISVSIQAIALAA